MKKELFYNSLKSRGSGVFGSWLGQVQVEGIESILSAGSHLPITHLAYALTTAYGETGGKMQPISENLNYTSAERLCTVWPSKFHNTVVARPYVRNPQGLANHVYGGKLGNSEDGDGWKYRGRGLVQLTGKTNYEKIKRLTGVDVVNNPDLALRTDVSAKALIVGIEHGIYTGKKASDYLPGDYHNARRIINGTFEASKYAGYARAFEEALRIAEYTNQEVRNTTTNRFGWLGRLFSNKGG